MHKEENLLEIYFNFLIINVNIPGMKPRRASPLWPSCQYAALRLHTVVHQNANL